jgi:F-type H+-transporting ATPase subunit delta
MSRRLRSRCRKVNLPHCNRRSQSHKQGRQPRPRRLRHAGPYVSSHALVGAGARSRDFDPFSNLSYVRAAVAQAIALTCAGRIVSDAIQRLTLAQEDTIVTGMTGRYASALFDLAQEQRAIDSVAADLRAFDAMVESSPDLQRLVRSPAFTAEEQTRALAAVLDKAGVTGLAANFIKLVAVKRRLFAVRDMIRDYSKLVDAAKGVKRAEVTVAEPLGDAHLAALKDALRQVSGSQSVELSVKVDPSIIGGLVVRLGSRMVDGSLRTKLNTIRNRMKEVG